MIVVEYMIASEPGRSQFAILPEQLTVDGLEHSFIGIATTRRFWFQPTLGCDVATSLTKPVA
jgi:hypothetical protein